MRIAPYISKAQKEKEYRENQALDKLKITCKCGRRKVIPAYVDRLICDWCGHWVYRTKAIEFKYKLNEEKTKKEKEGIKC